MITDINDYVSMTGTLRRKLRAGRGRALNSVSRVSQTFLFKLSEKLMSG